jgi:hypothetical protein
VPRTYVVIASLIIATFSYGQYKGWSLLPSDADRLERRFVSSGSSTSRHK